MAVNPRRIEAENRKIANICSSRGTLEQLGLALCPNGTPTNFLISGSAHPSERHSVLTPVLKQLMGRFPIVVVHNGDVSMEALMLNIWKSFPENERPMFWGVNNNLGGFEPFLGMDELQVIGVFRQLAKKLEYPITPRFETVIRAHLDILSASNQPIWLSGLYYLCQFRDMNEFHQNVMSLPCGEAAATRIWADLGIGASDGNSQFELFRAVVNNLARDASQCGWKPYIHSADDKQYTPKNAMLAVRNRACLVLSINNMYTELILSYLTEEFKTIGQPFFLLLDGVKLADESLAEYLRLPNPNLRYGIVADNLVDLIGGNSESLSRWTEKMNYFVLFKHNTGSTAAAFSEIIGKYEAIKVETSHGDNREYFRMLPRGHHEDVRYSTEMRYRVLPEELTALRPGQAIVFNTTRDEIIHYN